MIAKPSALERKVSKWEKTKVREKEKLARASRDRRLLHAFSEAVRVRDCGHCRACGVQTHPSGDPRYIGAAHHIVYRSASKRMAHDLNNGIWLCGRCHDDEHQHRFEIEGTAEALAITVYDPKVAARLNLPLGVSVPRSGAA